MKAAVCLLAILTAAASADSKLEPPPAPDLGRAFVTIPYSELRALWEAGQRKPEAAEAPEPAPVPHLVHRADVRITLGESSSQIDADFEVEALDKKWQRVPLLGGEVRLEKAEAGERSVVWENGYALLTNAAGKAPVFMQLVTRGTRAMTTPLKLSFGSASVKRLSVTGIPAGLEARVNGQPSVTSKGTTVFLLPGDAGEVTLELGTPKREEAPKPLPPITASHWQTQSQVLARYTEGRIRFVSHVLARANDGSGLELTLTLPANAGSINVTADDLADWSQTRNDEGQRLVHVRWKTRDLLDRDLVLTYAVPQSPLSEQWTLQAPTSSDDKEARHLYALHSAEGLELKGKAVRTETWRLPEWMRTEVGNAPFVTAEVGAQMVVQPHWLPTVATAEAIVSEAKAALRLVADGATQTSASYTIKHQSPLAWRLELPVGVELLSCQVGGIAVQPIQRENGAIELALPAPSKGTTTVALVYASKIKALDPVSGDVALELPRTPLFIEHLEWAVVIPATFEITAIDGNVSVSDSVPELARGGERAIALRKDFCRAERPAVSLFYQRRTLEK